jgi:hypothetical protein
VEKFHGALKSQGVVIARDTVHELLAHLEGGEELIQVCADASDPAVSERELRALAGAGRSFPRAGKRLLTLTRDGAPPEVPTDVIVQPAYEWMLPGPTSA